MGRASGADPLKGRIVAAWAVFALVLGAVLAIVQLVSETEIRFFGLPGSGPSSTAGLMILAGSGCVAWGFSVHLRCSDIVIRGNLKIIAALLAAWLLDVLLKYPVRSDLIVSIMWYLYYVPMMFIPTFFLASAFRAAALDRHAAWRRVVNIAWVVDAALCVLVLTNNYHNLVFAFDFSDPHWSRDYTYQAGYWCVTAWAWRTSRCLSLAKQGFSRRTFLLSIVFWSLLRSNYRLTWVFFPHMPDMTNSSQNSPSI